MNKDVEQTLKNLRGKYIKQVLLQLEGIDTLTPVVRKIVLDNFNDLMREVLKELGYDTP